MELPRRSQHVIVRVDGTLAPCFPMYSATCDWGVVGSHKFEKTQLDDMKKTCETHCFSTLNHNLAYCYDAFRVIKWVGKQALRGFPGRVGQLQLVAQRHALRVFTAGPFQVGGIFSSTRLFESEDAIARQYPYGQVCV